MMGDLQRNKKRKNPFWFNMKKKDNPKNIKKKPQTTPQCACLVYCQPFQLQKC